MGGESGHGFNESSAQDLTRMQSRCMPGLRPHLKLGVLFQDHMALEQIYFLEAVQLMVPLSHLLICSLYNINQLFFVSEFLDGKNLAEWFST